MANSFERCSAWSRFVSCAGVGIGAPSSKPCGSPVSSDPVVSDRPCRALDVARRAGVTAQLVDRLNFGGFDRPSIERLHVELTRV